MDLKLTSLFAFFGMLLLGYSGVDASLPIGHTVTLQSISHSNAGVTKRSANPDDLPIKYPGPVKEMPPDRYGGGMSLPGDEKMPEECRGKNYCTRKKLDYQESDFNKVVKHKDSNDLYPVPVITPILVNRHGDPDDKDDCESVVTFEPLYHVRAKSGEWLDVAQSGVKEKIRSIRLETCVDPQKACFTSWASDSGFFCKQKFQTWEVDVMHNNEIVKVKTDLPVCCSCHYKANIANRFKPDKKD